MGEERKKYACTVEKLKKYGYGDRVKKVQDSFGQVKTKIEELYQKLDDDRIDCKAFNETVRRRRLGYFAWLAKKENCTREEDEESDELFDEEKCPTVVKQSLIECGVEKFKARFEDFKNKLENAEDTTECKEIGGRNVRPGLYEV